MKFAYYDISTNFGALKKFLEIRDNNPEYDTVKEAGRVGLPTLLMDDEIIISPDDVKLKELFE